MRTRIGMLVIGLSTIVGCGTSPAPPNAATSQPSEQGRRFLTAVEPDSAIAVGEARQTLQSGEDVTLVGLIGGTREPFVDGLAAFTVVDESVPYCAPEEGCPTPWDYCCQQHQVKDNIATVKMVDYAGNPIAGDARELLGVNELSTVVIQGTCTRDDNGNLTVAADKVFVRPSE